jgi:hypothetical protein
MTKDKEPEPQPLAIDNRRPNGCPPGRAVLRPPHGGAIGNPPHERTDAMADLIMKCRRANCTVDETAAMVGVSKDTLYEHYRGELELSKKLINVEVVDSLISNALGGNVAAQIWWTKVQMGWTEKVVHEHSGADGGPIITEQQQQTSAVEERLAGIRKRLAGAAANDKDKAA